MRETHPAILLERKAALLRASTGNLNLKSKLAQPQITPSPHKILFQALIRPTMLLVRSPVLLVMSTYVALVFGLMYLLFTTFTDVFEGQYGFGTATSGLVYLGLGVALIIAMVIFGILGDRVQAAQMKADGVQQPRPEYRLILMIFFSPCVGLGLFLYGWTTYYKVHWIVPIIGTAVIGLGAFFVLVSSTASAVAYYQCLSSADANPTVPCRLVWLPSCRFCTWCKQPPPIFIKHISATCRAENV